MFTLKCPKFMHESNGSRYNQVNWSLILLCLICCFLELRPKKADIGIFLVQHLLVMLMLRMKFKKANIKYSNIWK